MALIRSLRWILLLGLVALGGGIVVTLLANVRVGPRASTLPPEEPALPGTRVTQRASRVEIVRTRRGAPTLRMKADESATYDNGRLDLTAVTFRLFAQDGEETVVEAPAARMLPYAEQPAAPTPATTARRQRADNGGGEGGSWLLTGGVKITAPDGLVLAMPTLAYDEAEGDASTADPVVFTRGSASGSATGMSYDIAAQVVRFPLQVAASMPLGSMGVVKLEAAAASHDLRKKRLEMERYRAVTERGETLSGTRLITLFHEGSGLERLEGDQGFVLESVHAVPVGGRTSPLTQLLALEGARTLRGQRLAVVFGGQPEPVSLEVTGGANLAATTVGAGGGPASVEAETLTFDLSEGSLSRARATGEVDLKGAPALGQSTGFRLRSKYLEALIDPSLGSIQKLEGTGEIRLSDQDMESHGSRTSLDPNADIVTLTGNEGEPANATWLGRSIQAERIEADRRHKTLSARGGVRASYQPPQGARPEGSSGAAASLPFFRGGETMYAMAGSLTFADQGKVAHYRDRVRLWQGDNRVEASEVDLNETEGTLVARVDVISTFRQPPPPADPNGPPAPPRNPSEDIVTVSAATMTYNRAASAIVYAGRVLISQGAMRVTGDTVTVALEPGGGSAERIEAAGNVEMQEQGRRGRGDRLVADLKANTLRLSGTGREAVVQDESGQQLVRGSTLTMDRTGDRILVESELGGRTWITLKPRQKGARGLGSDPRN